MPTPPLPGSGRAELRRRKKIKRIVVFAALTVVIVLLMLATVMLALEIAQARGDSKPSGTDDITTTTTPDTAAPTHSGYTAFMYDNSKATAGPLVLVNKSHKYVFPSGAAGLSDIRASRNKNADGEHSYSCEYDKLMDAEALKAFNSMMDAFYAATGNGYALVTAAYRTAEEQDALGLDTKGGYSDHHTGCLVTLKFYMDGIMYSINDTKFADSYAWLAEHGAEYGFVVRYPDSKVSITGVSNYSNAYRYVGVAHAAYMKANNLCLEEYIELLKSHTLTDSHLSSTDSQGNKYEIYRIPVASGTQTSVQVPEGKQYTISGDNDGGLVIAVKLS